MTQSLIPDLFLECSFKAGDRISYEIDREPIQSGELRYVTSRHGRHLYLVWRDGDHETGVIRFRRFLNEMMLNRAKYLGRGMFSIRIATSD